MGILDHFSDMFEWHRKDRRKLKKLKKKPLQKVEIRAKIDCEGCERRVRKSVEGMKGVTQVDLEPKQHKLTVIGHVDPDKVLRRVRHRTGKIVQFWPYVQYDLVDHPYAPGVYDKKAPPGYVRNVFDNSQLQTSSLVRASSPELKYTTAFSDENTNACVVM